MKININDISDKVQIQVIGNEPWLANIYGQFPPLHGHEAPLVRASLNIEKTPGEEVLVTGEVKFEPFVACSRCSDPIIWPIDRSFSVTFRSGASASEWKRDRALSAEELDEYYLEDGLIDIEELLNEQIHLALPMKTILVNAKGACSFCGEDLSEDSVYRDSQSSFNPFAALKGLRRQQ